MVEQELPFAHAPLSVFDTIENDKRFYFYSDEVFIPSTTTKFDLLPSTKEAIPQGQDRIEELLAEDKSPGEIFDDLSQTQRFGPFTWIVRSQAHFFQEVGDEHLRDGILNAARTELQRQDEEEQGRKELAKQGKLKGGTGTILFGNRQLLLRTISLLEERATPSTPAMRK